MPGNDRGLTPHCKSVGLQSVENVSSFKYLGVHITKDLTWTTHIDTVTAKARQHLYHLRQLKKFKVSQKVPLSFYSAAVQSTLMPGMGTAPLRQDGPAEDCAID